MLGTRGIDDAHMTGWRRLPILSFWGDRERAAVDEICPTMMRSAPHSSSFTFNVLSSHVCFLMQVEMLDEVVPFTMAVLAGRLYLLQECGTASVSSTQRLLANHACPLEHFKRIPPTLLWARLLSITRSVQSVETQMPIKCQPVSISIQLSCVPDINTLNTLSV